MSNGKKLTKRRIKKKNNDCFWMENIFCLESHIHLCSRHTSAIPAYVIKTCVTWHAISGTRYWGFVSPKLHVSTYRNQQHCWWFHYIYYESLIHSQTSKVQPLKFGNERVISPHILPTMWEAPDVLANTIARPLASVGADCKGNIFVVKFL